MEGWLNIKSYHTVIGCSASSEPEIYVLSYLNIGPPCELRLHIL